jgi:DNA-binding GntR family transcriptional regulator
LSFDHRSHITNQDNLVERQAEGSVVVDQADAVHARLAGGSLYRPVARDTVQEQVYRQLKEAILDGEIEPGSSVTIQALAEAFGVSAMPVREALHRLSQSGAMTVVARRSAGIPPLSIARLRDLRRVRVEVEGLAAAWAAANVTPALLARLDALIARMESSTAAVDRKPFVPANREFHFAIYEAAGSESLLAVIEPLWLQIGPYLALLRGSGNWRAANHQHRVIRDALARGDGDAARLALRSDIDEAAAILEGLLAR